MNLIEDLKPTGSLCICRRETQCSIQPDRAGYSAVVATCTVFGAVAVAAYRCICFGKTVLVTWVTLEFTGWAACMSKHNV